MLTDINRLNKEILHERVSVWYVWDGVEFRVLIKAPGTAIKALSKGCRLELTFGLDSLATPNILHTGCRIYDHPIHYLSITGVQRFYEEHYGLLGVLQHSSVRIQFHDELCVCAATARLQISEKNRKRAIDFIGDIDRLYYGGLGKRIKRSLDAFDFSLGQRPVEKGFYVIDTLTIESKLSNWQSSKNTFFLNNEVATLQIDGTDQGAILEKQVGTILDQLFEKQLYRSPRIPYKKGKTRELTDILAFSDYGVFLIETKALNVLTRNEDITMERKVAGLKKQICKAIDQLVGATKKIVEGIPIYDTQGDDIAFDKKLFPHCIVLVSELLPFGEWEDVVIKIFQAAIDHPMYLNVMELSELMYFIGAARGNKDRFDYFLVKRMENLIKHRNIHARTVIDPQGDTI